jgi:nicotinate phosphoribosyltransferase
MAAARGRSVVDFGTRRAHGPEAGLFAARSSYIGGCDGTSNVEAGALFGIPTLGTLAHAFIMAFEKEEDAFRVFLNTFPETATLLVDTYDTIAAVELIAQELHQTPSVRLDSGDILELSRKVRSILDRAGMTQTKIFASGDLNEYRIAELVEGGTEIDGFGVGTELATSYDAPALSGVYKLVSYETEGSVKMRIKLSPEKATYPGAKQVWRYFDESGTYTHDLITAADDDSRQSDERPERALPLLQQVMTEGRRLDESLTPKEVVDRARARASEEIKRMPEYLKRIERSYPDKYPVRVSERLESLRARVAQDLKHGS